MMAIWRAALEEIDNGRDCVIATIVSVKGSSPRHLGTRFLVRRDGSIVGTIGGGLFEANVQQFAASALQHGTSHRALFSFQGTDAQSTQMICGGQAEVLVEFVDAQDEAARELFLQLCKMNSLRNPGYLFTRIDIDPGGEKRGSMLHLLADEKGSRTGGFPEDDEAVNAVPQRRLLKPAQLMSIPGLQYPVFLESLHPRGTVYIFGAGHVGACVAHLAGYVDFRVVVIDDRSEFADREKIPEADEVVAVNSFDSFFADRSLDEDAYVVIVTRGHAHDKLVLTHALQTHAGYIGMIGSRRKTNLIYQSLLMEGFTQEELQRVHSPIGLPLGGETPEEIGVSIIGEMIEMRSRKDRIERRGD